MLCPKCGADNLDNSQFCAACGEQLQFEKPQPGAAREPEPYVPLKMSGLAIASLVFGVLGFLTCGVLALPGLILGIVALVKINANRERMTGQGLAIAGIASSAIAILMMPIMAAILFPVFARAREAARMSACQSNVKQLGMSVRMYMSDYDDKYPPAATWSDSLQKYARSPSVYQCPSAAPSLRCGYALNGALGEQPEGNIADAAGTVGLFESDGGWNAAGGQEAMITRARHINGVVVGYADGHVSSVSPGAQSGFLRWAP